MLLNISSSLNTIKKQSIIVLAQNVNIRFPKLRDDLLADAKTAGGIFRSLLWMLNFNQSVLSSSNVSASYLLSYLDFYALYSMIYSNYDVFNNLKDISEKKYQYIYELYKSLDALIKEKEKSIDYFFVQQVNFNSANYINQTLSGLMNRKNKISYPLSFKGILTLPVRTEKIVNPSYLTFYDTDSAQNEIKSENGLDFLKYYIHRKQNNKIGIPIKSSPASGLVVYSILPEIEGTIFGYFTDVIYVECSDLTFNDSGQLTEIKLRASTNGFDWSDQFSIAPGVKSSLFIEDNIEIGLTIVLYDNYRLTKGDRWLIQIVSTEVDSPRLKLKIGFDFLEPISFVSFKDESSFKLQLNSATIDRRKHSNEKLEAAIYDSRIGHIGVIEGPINKYEVDLTQNNYTISSSDESLRLLYDFKIKDIVGVLREYEAHGSAVFEKLKVENINTVSLFTKEYIPGEDIHSLYSWNTPKCHIEKNILIETSVSKSLIPIIENDLFKKFEFFEVNYLVAVEADLLSIFNSAPKGSIAIVEDSDKAYSRGDSGWEVYKTIKKYTQTIVKHQDLESEYTWIFDGSEWQVLTKDSKEKVPLIFEVIVPDEIVDWETLEDYAPANYTPRFPVDLDYCLTNDEGYSNPVQIYDIKRDDIANFTYHADTNLVAIHEYRQKNLHGAWDAVKINNISDICDSNADNGKWIKAGIDIYYMYYVDEYDYVQLAIRSYDFKQKQLVPFTGEIALHVEMRSNDQLYYTPMMFEFAIAGV